MRGRIVRIWPTGQKKGPGRILRRQAPVQSTPFFYFFSPKMCIRDRGDGLYRRLSQARRVSPPPGPISSPPPFAAKDFCANKARGRDPMHRVPPPGFVPSICHLPRGDRAALQVKPLVPRLAHGKGLAGKSAVRRHGGEERLLLHPLQQKADTPLVSGQTADHIRPVDCLLYTSRCV